MHALPELLVVEPLFTSRATSCPNVCIRGICADLGHVLPCSHLCSTVITIQLSMLGLMRIHLIWISPAGQLAPLGQRRDPVPLMQLCCAILIRSGRLFLLLIKGRVSVLATPAQYDDRHKSNDRQDTEGNTDAYSCLRSCAQA